MKICQIASHCPGCSLWDIPYVEQSQQKINKLKNLFSLNEVSFLSAGEFGLRERFDFIIKGEKIGLINKNRELIPIEECLQLTPGLQKAFNILLKHNFNIKIGTIRLREPSHGKINKFGLWLDFANEDIKRLLVEKNLLIELSKDFFIEVGQKKKCLNPNTFFNEQIKLSDPENKPWFHTTNYKSNTPIDLYCAVSSFTQPSAKSAKLITDTFIPWLSVDEYIWEYGCGIGQYTLALLSLNHHVNVFENDLFALDCLQKTVFENGFKDKLTMNIHDNLKKPSTVLVNPPKSGLKEFVQTVLNTNAEKIIYVSCFPETLKADSEYFLKHGYEIKKAAIVDQFPQTEHFEVVMLFTKTI
jgi:23S rRNA (uracil1939-C5)-methyltransferase